MVLREIRTMRPIVKPAFSEPWHNQETKCDGLAALEATPFTRASTSERVDPCICLSREA